MNVNRYYRYFIAELINADNVSVEQVEDYFLSFVTQCKKYLSFYGINSFLYCILPFNKTDSYTDLKQKCIENINLQSDVVYEMRCTNHYNQLIEMRNEFYLNPQKEFLTKELCQQYSFSPSYLRVI